MPEMLFAVRWPDGTVDECYSPSLVIQDHLTESTSYDVESFKLKAEKSLSEASERVRARFGFPCSRALAQKDRILRKCLDFSNNQNVEVLYFTKL